MKFWESLASLLFDVIERSQKIPSLTVENQKPTAKPLSMRLAVGFIFVLLSGILSIFAFLLNCFHILLCDEFIVCTKSAHIM